MIADGPYSVEKVEALAATLANRPYLLLSVLKEMGLQIVCERPGCEGIVQHPTRSMMHYSWDGKGEDPNRDLLLCYNCSCEHIDQMTAQYYEYCQGLL